MPRTPPLPPRRSEVHSPACPSLKEHLSRCIAALDTDEGWNLDDFVSFARMTWDTERIVSDPDLTWIYERQRAESVA
jgi:hypothetical protein